MRHVISHKSILNKVEASYTQEMPTLAELLITVAILAPLSVITLWGAVRRKFFTYDTPADPRDCGISVGRLLAAVVIYLGVLIVLVLLFGGILGGMILSPIITLIGLLLLWPNGWAKLSWKEVGYGCASWIVAWPVVALGGTVVALILYALGFSVGETEQVVIRQLIEAKGSLFILVMVLYTVFFAPCIEELFFRGFLQGWLRRKFQRQVAILIASAIFATVHLAPGQESTNILLFPVVGALGWFLGHLYEKRGTLVSPIALHMVYNGVSVIYTLLAK
jgi:membrane protease YdiL (CAAX protease family)